MIRELARFAWIVRNPFHGLDANPALPSQGRAGPLPRLRYTIFFMPRTSSTRLTHLLRETGRMGAPEEWFNPTLIRQMAAELRVANREDYLQALLRTKAVGGVFGAEVTWLQMMALFHGEARFFKAFQPDRLIWLLREDMVAQAVSAVRMVQTGVSQSVSAALADRSRAEQVHSYDPGAIARSLHRLLWQENRSEALIRRAQQPLLRLSYEQLVSSPESAILDRIARHLDLSPDGSAPPVSGHEKLSGAKSAEFAAQFRKTHAGLVARLDRTRETRLQALHAQT